METLKQVLTVPENHQLHFDITLPNNFPTGPAEVLLVFSPQSMSSVEAANAGRILELVGALKNSPNLSGDSLTTQKALRNEWER